MELYKSKQEFRDAIIAASDYYKVSPAIVEKDYFVTVILEQLKEKIPGILFKGGTSLSKCFKIIDRFSEDIDLTLDLKHYSQSNKKNANKAVIAVCDELGFEIENREQVELHSHGNYNCYNIIYPLAFSDYSVSPFIKIEMVFAQKAFPDTDRPVCSMIGEYLATIEQYEALSMYGLEPYEIKVQSLERTLIDKVFALCDYYMRGEVKRHSRHIYDIFKLTEVIDLKNLPGLIEDVREERSTNKTCVSAQPEVDVSDILTNIVEEAFFKKDYEEVTEALLIEKVRYEEAVSAIKQIAEEKIF